MRAPTAPWEKEPLRSIAEEWARAARSRRVSAWRGDTWLAARASFITASNADSDGVRALWLAA